MNVNRAKCDLETSINNYSKKSKFTSRLKNETKKWLKNWNLYVLLAPAIIYLIIFQYIPMYGIVIAFKDYVPSLGISGSEFVGMKHFIRFFENHFFWQLLKNTLVLSVLSLIVNTILPIILALIINELRCKFFKKSVQTISYAPYFVSLVVVVGMCFTFLNADRGIINKIIMAFGGDGVAFMESTKAFPLIYVVSGLWQGLGWCSIIYIGTLSNVDPALHEAATIDGASRFKRMIHINLPAILPIATIMFVLALGSLLSIGFEKVYLMQTDLNRPASNIISTYVYEVAFKSRYPDWSYGTAVGLFNTVINLILLVSSNFVSKKVGGESLW